MCLCRTTGGDVTGRDGGDETVERGMEIGGYCCGRQQVSAQSSTQLSSWDLPNGCGRKGPMVDRKE